MPELRDLKISEYDLATLEGIVCDITKAIKNKKSDYFPTFNTAKYFRNVTNTYSTVCLPFPVAKETVTDAGAELFDFTSIKKNGEQ